MYICHNKQGKKRESAKRLQISEELQSTPSKGKETVLRINPKSHIYKERHKIHNISNGLFSLSCLVLSTRVRRESSL